MEELTIKELLQVCKLYGHECPENLTIEQIHEFIRCHHQIIKHLKEYLPGLSLSENHIKNDVFSLTVGSFSFRVESFPNAFWVSFGVAISKDSTYTIKSEKAETFPEACKVIREFLSQEKAAITKILGE